MKYVTLSADEHLIEAARERARALFSLAAALLCTLPGLVQAAPVQPAAVVFQHHDWEIVCDNTRTCRAAGYHADNQPLAVSVLLTRQAGPGQPVSAELMLGDYVQQPAFSQLPDVVTLAMRINGRPLGTVRVPQAGMKASLSADQVKALLAALPRRGSVIEWAAGAHRWVLSDAGAAAVLLKMDEAQGRLGTPGALLRQGSRDEAGVLPPLPVPVLQAAKPALPRPGDAGLAQRHDQALRAALRASVPNDDCDLLHDLGGERLPIEARRLSADRLQVSTPCWRAAYNSGSGVWVVRDAPPFAPELVTVSATEWRSGDIRSAQKGRGLGDCWSLEAWTWDGRHYVQTEQETSGMCKLMAPGGAWSLPTLRVKVLPVGP